jgi:DNA mismatch repair protein MutL
MSYIRVTDDGCGIPAGELETAFLRHATSKIRSEYDLEAIGTLGFRGEALAAIAAVSRVEVVTRTAACDFGAALTLEGGTVRSREEAGGPVGTTMIVRDLFFNTPARLKYMKKDAAEGAAVFAAVQREALARPEVAVKFIRDGRQELLTPGDGALKSAVYAVLGRDLALGLLPVRGSGEEGVRVEGFVSLPACCRASRNYQFFFVNGRFVKSRTMMAALEQAYANQKMVGKFPGCVLHITTRPNAVDVNVHPAKTEVKFVSDKRVFDGVYHTVLGGLDASTQRPAAVITAVKTPAVEPHDTVTPNQTRLEPVPPPGAGAPPRSGSRAQGGAPPGTACPAGGAARLPHPRPHQLPALGPAGPLGSLPLSDFAKPRAAAPAPAPRPSRSRPRRSLHPRRLTRRPPPRPSPGPSGGAVPHLYSGGAGGAGLFH